MTIIKVATNEMYTLLGRNAHEVLLADHRQWPLGKVVLSLKDGKKRRLVKGFIDFEADDDKDFGLSYKHYFKPRNIKRLCELLGQPYTCRWCGRAKPTLSGLCLYCCRFM